MLLRYEHKYYEYVKVTRTIKLSDFSHLKVTLILKYTFSHLINSSNKNKNLIHRSSEIRYIYNISYYI